MIFLGHWLIAIVSTLGSLGALVWISLAVRSIFHRAVKIRMDDLTESPPPEGWPTLAVIFAARNEAADVERATRSILAQDYPNYQLIAVDDRSTDTTGTILESVACEDTRLQVVHVSVLPNGWLGKNHALQSAADSAQADWLLFTDADVIFTPCVLKRSVAWALVNRYDHLTLVPDMPTENLGERCFLAFFCLAFALAAPPWRVMNPRSKASLGVGAFNLVRSEAFHAVGGFRRLALSIDDDLQLGRSLKFGGYKAGVALGQHQISVRWHVGIGGMIRGLEKNFFAGSDFRLWTIPPGVLFILALGVFPLFGVFVGSFWVRPICALGVASTAFILAGAGGQNGVYWYHAFGLPLGALAFALAAIRSTFITLRNDGVSWRGHHYPLPALRAHVRLRNAWSRAVWRSTH